MYKVVIVDDKEIIVEGLKKMIPWEKYNCEILSTAADGKSGADVIRKCRPDILFTDIHMPGLDGLSMLMGLKSEFPDMQITVLTGYRNFEYAQKAIRLGVMRYLLKPSKMSELEEALQAMTQKLDELDSRDAVPFEYDGQGEQGASESNSFIVRNALQYMDEHYAEKLTLIDVSEKAYVSQWHLSKLLKKHTGQNFCNNLNYLRIKKAKELLRNPSLRIHEISEMVGFSDVTHFSKIFKKIESISPNDFRNSTSRPLPDTKI